MYRPKNWKNPFKGVKWTGDDHLVDDAYEAGADAILEALKERGKYNTAGYGTTDFPQAREGWFVFIPDEQVKKDG